MIRSLLALAAITATTNAVGAPDALETLVQRQLQGFSGTVRIYAKNLDTGATYSLSGEERVRTASTIKLPVMVEAFAAVAEGRLKWEDTARLVESGKVSGSGVLTELSPGLDLPLRDLVHLMIVVSDNTATNMVLAKVGGDAVNARMEKLGLRETKVLRMIGGKGATRAGEVPDNKRWGLGVTTPRDMVALLEKIERGEVVSAEASREMVAILKRQQYKDGIGRRVTYPVASKSGALDALRSDVGIVYAPQGRIAIAITVDNLAKPDWSEDNPGLLLIADVAKAIVENLK